MELERGRERVIAGTGDVDSMRRPHLMLERRESRWISTLERKSKICVYVLREDEAEEERKLQVE